MSVYMAVVMLVSVATPIVLGLWIVHDVRRQRRELRAECKAAGHPPCT